VAPPAPAAPFSVRGAPHLDSSFIGRDRELAQVAELLAAPDCRLLSVIGPGGMGKTRLSLASAALVGPRLAQGAAFVALAPISAPALIASTVADVLGLRLSEQTPGAAALTTALGEQSLLLILDNCEHLIAAVTELALQILRAAPRVRIMVTSRERLGIQGERILDLEGMSYPSDPQQPGDPARYSALSLFNRRAQAVQPGFQLSAEVLPSVIEICRLVGGLPLGVELAASWSRSLTPPQIAAEIAAGADFLTSRMRDAPQRHRSLRTVFEHSWQLLGADEQRMLSHCAIFQGGFSVEAALAIPVHPGPAQRGQVLHILAGLVDKSLLRHDDAGRYHMHELVRQYAYEHLDGDQATFRAVTQRLISYFAAWSAEQGRKAAGPERRQALVALGHDIDNLRAAWRYALQRLDLPSLSLMLPGLCAYYDARGQFQLALEQIGQAIDSLGAAGPAAQPLIAAIQSQCGHFADRMGQYQQAEAFLQAALPVARSTGDRSLEAEIINLLGRVSEHRGALDSAIEAYTASIALYRQIGDRYNEASALHNLGSVYESKAEYATARSLLEQVLDLRRSIGDLRGVAFSLNTLGIVLEMQGDYPAAVSLYLESVGAFEAVGEGWAMIFPIGNLGDVATTSGEYAAAQTYYRRAMELTRERWLLPHMLMNLVKMAQLFARVGHYQLAAELIAIPLVHPATDELFRRAAERLLHELSAAAPSDQLAQALAHGRSQSLNAMINTVLATPI
jgi:predicted ATPase